MGAGIARDLALRGIETTLLEGKDFCSGASGGNHGMLHSGARYAVKDPESARECAAENKVLKKIASYCIDDCGGLFVGLPGDDPTYNIQWWNACRETGVQAVEISPTEARSKEPKLASDILFAYEVNDASIDPFSLVLGNIESARGAGARVLNYRRVESFKVSKGRIEEVVFRDFINGEAERLKPEIVVNAAGAWAAQVAALAHAILPLKLDKGSMVVLDGRSVNGLVNHLRMPSDGDIIVANHSAAIIGTTSIPMSQPGEISATEEEVRTLIAEASRMIPQIKKGRAVRAYAGMRSLINNEPGRESTRGFKVIDHSKDGIDNLVSVVGGKLTTYRLIAEKASDLVSSLLGSGSDCITHREPLYEDSESIGIDGMLDFPVKRMIRKYGPRQGKVAEACLADIRGREILCSCEQTLRGELEYFASDPDVRTLADLTRRTRAGMGYCQSGLCALKMLSVAAPGLQQDPKEALEVFLTERWKGLRPVLKGEQLRQEVFKSYLLDGTYRLMIGGERR